MKVRVLSFNAVGEFAGFQFMMVPGGMGLDPQGRLVQGPPQPQPMILVAFKDQFAWGPVHDIVPVWDDLAKIQELPKPKEPTPEELAELEARIEEIANGGATAEEVVADLPNEGPKVVINTAESAGV